MKNFSIPRRMYLKLCSFPCLGSPVILGHIVKRKIRPMKKLFCLGLLGACGIFSLFLSPGFFAQEKEAEAESSTYTLPGRLWQYSETRESIAEDYENFWGWQTTHLRLRFDLPEELKNPSSWGSLEVTSAKDNLGTDLLLKDDFSEQSATTRSFDNPEDTIEKGFFVLPIHLEQPLRKAETIDVQGSFILVYSEKNKALVENPRKLLGEKIFENEDLGVKVVLTDFMENTIRFKVYGNTDYIIDFNLLNAAGEPLDRWGPADRWPDRSTVEMSVNFHDDIPEGAQLEITYAQKLEKKTITFDVKKIKLP